MGYYNVKLGLNNGIVSEVTGGVLIFSQGGVAQFMQEKCSRPVVDEYSWLVPFLLFLLFLTFLLFNFFQGAKGACLLSITLSFISFHFYRPG